MKKNISKIPSFDDPTIYTKKKIIDEEITFSKEGFPLPAQIEISESGMCNRKCSFCPRSDPDYKHVNEFITNELVNKLTLELKELNYTNMILFSGFVEPLLDKNIFNIIKIIRNNLEKSRIHMVSNGDVLNKERTLKLFKSGLSRLLISIYDGPEAEKKMYDLMHSCNLADDQYKIRKRYLSEEETFGITLSNRGGMMKNAKYKIKNPSESLVRPCNYPAYTFFIDYNGDVLMCTHDWGKKFIIGNLNQESFKDLWLSQKWMEARHKLSLGKRDFSPCNVCDVDGMKMGGRHVEAWNDFTNKK
jgi:radical SAM protein with 4Fe4S-binding SPASM domain